MRFANAFAKSHGVELENDYKGDKRITYLNHAHDERASDFDKLLSKATGESDKVRGKDYDAWGAYLRT